MATIITAPRKRTKDAIYIKQRYLDNTGKRCQCKIPCTDLAEARTLLPAVIAAEKNGDKYHKPKPIVYRSKALDKYGISRSDYSDITISQLIPMYLDYAAANGRLRPNTLAVKRNLCSNYVYPYIGDVSVRDITPAFLQDYFTDLPNHTGANSNHQSDPQKITTRTVIEIRKILSPALAYAVINLRIIDKNPIIKEISIPSKPFQRREQWSADEYLYALNRCDDAQLRLSMALMVAGPLRSAELLGICWDCVHLDAPIPYIDIKRQLQRLPDAEVADTRLIPVVRFPKITAKESLYLIDYTKTSKSIRKIYLPRTVALLLALHKENQIKIKEYYEDRYVDYNLVIAQEDSYPGRPITTDVINRRFKRLIAKYNLREVTYYSLRGTGATQKLRATTNPALVSADMGGDSERIMMEHYIKAEDDDRKSLSIAIEDNLFKHMTL